MRRWNAWAKGKVALCGLAAASAAFSFDQASGEIEWWAPLIGLVLTPLALLFVVGFQAYNPFSAPLWQRPSWRSNPLRFKEPLNFFHFAGWSWIASGAGMFVPALRNGRNSLVGTLFVVSSGIGVLVGVRLCELVWRRKFVPAQKDLGGRDAA